MPRKVKSVRVPEELATIDLSGIIAECERYLRDIESATLLKQSGDKDAAEALLRARQIDLGKKVGMKVWEARKAYGLARIASLEEEEAHQDAADNSLETENPRSEEHES